MRMNTQRILAALLSLVLLLALAPAGWAENVDEGGSGSSGEGPLVTASTSAAGVDLSPGANTVTINLVPSDKEGTDFETDIVNAQIVADLYLVAAAVKDEKYDTYHYEFVDYAPIRIIHATVFEENLADDPDPAKQNNPQTMLEKFTSLAHSFADALLSDDNIIEPISSDPTAGATSIYVDELDPGLYMLILRGNELVRKSDDADKSYVTEMTKVDASGNPIDTFTATRAFSDAHEFIFEPQMITVPTRVDDQGNQQYNTAYGTKWSNDLTIVAKPDWRPRYGDLKIVKTLNEYIGTDPATFVYKITAETVVGSETRVIFSDVAAINYPNETEVVVEKQIPIGASITVEEAYEGSRYTAVGEITQTTSILKPSVPASVEFTNEHNNTDTGGYGVINKSVYHEDSTDSSTGEWDYQVINPVNTQNG